MLRDSLDGFQSELTKIAVIKKQKKRSMGAAIAGGLAASYAPNISNAAIGLPVKAYFNKLPRVSVNQQNQTLNRVQRQMGMSHLPIEHQVVDGSAIGAHAKPFMGTNTDHGVHIPTGANESIMAHELGHIKTHQAIGRLGSRLALGARYPFQSGIVPSMTSAWAGGQDDPSWAPAIANAAIASPTLIDELAASGHAVRHMVKNYGWKAGLSKSRALLPAFGTYAGLTAAPAAVTGVRKLYRRFKGDETPQIKQANMGTVLGGVIGYGLAPNSMKGKVIGTLAGGALGGGTFAAGRKAKHMLYDEPMQRERAALESHVPSAVQQRAASPYGPYSY